jgi:plastocyanin
MGRLLAVGVVVIVALVAVLVVNGEGPNKPEETEAAVPEQQSSQVRDPSPAQADTSDGAAVGATVRMKHLRFAPGAVSVDVGEAVRFVNDDNVAHTIFQDFGARSGQTPAVDSERILPGETYSFTVRDEGLISYVCTLHPSVMSGQILAEKPAA